LQSILEHATLPEIGVAEHTVGSRKVKMKLEFTQNLGCDDLQLAAETATPDDLLKLMDSMTWQTLSMVLLTDEKGVELEASGSIEDGMCVTYTEDGKMWISTDSPTVEQARSILQRFAARNAAWREPIRFEFFQNTDGSPAEGQARPKSGCLGMVALILVLSVLAVSRIMA
jgi:hypothetical protein